MSSSQKRGSQAKKDSIDIVSDGEESEEEEEDFPHPTGLDPGETEPWAPSQYKDHLSWYGIPIIKIRRLWDLIL